MTKLDTMNKLEALLAQAKEIDLDVQIVRDGTKVHVTSYPEGSTNPVRAKRLSEEIADVAVDFYKLSLTE